MDLLFTTLEVVAVILSVMLARMVCEDGESNWLEGLMLLMVYAAILGVAFFFLPEKMGHHGTEGAARSRPLSTDRAEPLRSFGGAGACSRFRKAGASSRTSS